MICSAKKELTDEIIFFSNSNCRASVLPLGFYFAVVQNLYWLAIALVVINCISQLMTSKMFLKGCTITVPHKTAWNRLRRGTFDGASSTVVMNTSGWLKQA